MKFKNYRMLTANNERLTSKDIRQVNVQSVLKALHQEQLAPISRLRDLTGLSVVTITKVLEYLEKTGIVLSQRQNIIGTGRPPLTYRFNATYRLLLIVSCFQRGGQNFAGYSVHDLFGECLERREELLATIHTDDFRIGIERYLEHYPKIAIIGISMPSDTVGGRVAAAIRHDPMSKRLARHLEQHFKVPVFFETDINAAALGCYKRNPSHEFVAGIVLMPGRAPGCSFCFNGKVIRGRDGMAGEVRYFPMYNDVGILPADPSKADELALRTLRAVMCVMNPSLVAVYTEGLKSGLSERLRNRVFSEAEIAMLPKIEVSSSIKDDIVSGMITLCLERLPNLL